MNIQMLLLLAVMGITLLYGAGKRTAYHKKICVGTVTTVLTLFSGLRTWWFGDLIKYYTLYLHCTGEGWKEYVFDDFSNIGIRLLFRGCGWLHISYDVCLFLIAAFVAITLGVLVFRYSSSPYWSYLMYIAMGFYIFTYSGLKQAVAMAFCCLAMCCIMDSRPGKFVLWVLIGALFHGPALIFLAAYPFAHKKIDRLYFLFILVCLGIVFLFRNQIVSFLSEMYYEDESTYEANKLIGGRFLMMVFILVVSLVLRPLRNSDTRYRYVFNVMVFAAMLQTFSVYDNNFTRLTDYYYQFVVLLIPLMLEPWEVQQEANPQLTVTRRIPPVQLYLIGVGITAFAIWFYSGQIGPGTICDSFKFCWEIDPYSLYGY